MASRTSNSFFLLDERIQRFLWQEQWEALREAQEAAIPLIVGADRDVIVAAATAAGKTEAAFLPALTHLLQQETPALIVYISPLKALINDQFGRLERLCEQLEIPVWPWHGDIAASTKAKFTSQRHGVLLITPESLEAQLCNRGTAVAALFERAAYFVIDELHAFIGSERGKQLQSLLHRIDTAIKRTTPRIGLSATLGDMNLAAEFLRPGGRAGVAMVVSKSEGGELRILLKGYEEPLVVQSKTFFVDDAKAADDDDEEPPEPKMPAAIATHLLKNLRGSNNLIFPNSRREVERYTYLLNRFCDEQQVPNEFWPHHGSLSKELRLETEAALKQKERPASAICTNTLELGIDIGAVKSVAQIGPPPSVASLRQRLGRSGRRKGEPAILRGYTIENALGGKSSLATDLRLNTVQTIAMISLLIEGWFEPPVVHGMHLSTLVQQVLSIIAQYGGATIGQLYGFLCAPGCPFSGVSKDEFVALIRHMGQKELLVQESSGLLLHGQLGEKFVNHYSFFAAFASEEEFRIVCGNRTLGTLPVSQMLAEGQRILFGGRTWKVKEVLEDEKMVVVEKARGGVAPAFSGGAGRTHSKVRQRMREVLEAGDSPAYLDPTAAQFLMEARQSYHRLGLHETAFLDLGSSVVVLAWLGDDVNEAIACLLRYHGFEAMLAGPFVEVQKSSREIAEIIQALKQGIQPECMADLFSERDNLQREKWDWALPASLLRKAYTSRYLDLAGMAAWAANLTAASA
ncbi:DEAD/DEAH box helicase [Chromobacterium sp. Panama]|uniref:DEAD/DEAH box helicase n=1 Tax=Chromobacterium sp. Panama TaxID=2161826 RepID=UPI000D316844|nr:DEAD/DEAH box helicase [Chromobacterium sp. Panama]PTU66931.1 DEAD/DEAH box helicase [Chromobacterium sp. Panama]